MKKLLILMSLIGIFVLASCDKSISDTTINNNQNNTTESKQTDEPSSTNEVTPSVDIGDSSKDKVDETNPTVDNTPVDNTTVEPSKDKDDNPSTSIEDKTEEPSDSSKEKEESSGSGNVYDDGIDWGPLHQ